MMVDPDLWKLIVVAAPLVAGWNEQRRTRLGIDKLHKDLAQHRSTNDERISRVEGRMDALEEKVNAKNP